MPVHGNQIVFGSAWCTIDHVPVHHNTVGVRHEGLTLTAFTNEDGPAIRWRAVLPGRWDSLTVNGETRLARTRATEWGSTESYVEVWVGTGEMAAVAVSTM